MSQTQKILNLGNDLPGIMGLLTEFPDHAKALGTLAQTLLVGDSPLTRWEREMVATFVSKVNGCKFCYESHLAVALALRPDTTREEIDTLFSGVGIPPRMYAIFELAYRTTLMDAHEHTFTVARKAGELTDREIHDVVLIASAFNLFNRYVDTLTPPPEEGTDYTSMGKMLAEKGYLQHG